MREHGTRSMYVGGCRCAACAEASRQYHRQRRTLLRQRRIVGPDNRPIARVPSDLHGQVGTYTNRQCRCPECSQAIRDYNRRLRLDQMIAAEVWEAVDA